MVKNDELNFKDIKTEETPYIETSIEELIKIKNDLIS